MATVTPTVLVVSRDPEIKQAVTALQSDGLTVRTIANSRELPRALTAAKGHCVAVLDGELVADASFSASEALEKLRTVPLLVLLAPDGDALTNVDPERTAVEEYARKPIAGLVLSLRVKALILAAGLTLPESKQQHAPAESGPLDFANDVRGQLTVVFSVKGGSGKSTIAAHLAAGLASMYSLSTLLVDANLWFGDIGVLLNVSSTRSSFDVCSGDEPDLFGLPKAVVPHASGAAVLLRPPDPLSVEKVRIRSFVDAIERYRSLYEHVIADCATSLDELNLDLLENASRILLVVTPEMGALHNTVRFLSLAGRLGHSDKISLVLNRCNSGIDSDDLQRTLGIPVACGVVSAGRMMLDAVNEGTTLFAMDPTRRERITQDLAGVVEHVAGRAQPPVKREEERRRASPLSFLRRSA